jgi:hypothetical protein
MSPGASRPQVREGLLLPRLTVPAHEQSLAARAGLPVMSTAARAFRVEVTVTARSELANKSAFLTCCQACRCTRWSSPSTAPAGPTSPG